MDYKITYFCITVILICSSCSFDRNENLDVMPVSRKMALGYVSGEADKKVRNLNRCEIEQMIIFKRYLKEIPPYTVAGQLITLPHPPVNYYFIQEVVDKKNTSIVCLFDEYGELLPGQIFTEKKQIKKWKSFLKGISSCYWANSRRK